MIHINDLLWDYILKPKGMMVWRDVPGYDGLYQISNHGDVRLVKTTLLNDTSVHLIGLDKSIQAISRRKLFKRYWPNDNEQYKGEERWKKIDHYGDYFISNYENVKRLKILVLSYSKKSKNIVFTKKVDGKKKRATASIMKIFLLTFPPYEIEINHEDKTLNYKKKDDFIDTPQQRTA